MIPLRQTESGVSFALRVQPRASRTAITGVLGAGEGAALKVALAAPPVEGRANEALVSFLAELFAVPRSAVAVIGGLQSRNKTIRISGVSSSYVQDRLKIATAEK